MKDKDVGSWFKKHVDTIVVLGGILSATLWMTSQIHNIDNRLKVIETVLIVKNIMPKELCNANTKPKNDG